MALNNLSMSNLDLSQANVVLNQPNTDQSYEVIAALSAYNGRRNNYNNKGAKCIFCGMNGHTIYKCYKKHGYPQDGFQASNQRENRLSKEQYCRTLQQILATHLNSYRN